MKKVLSFGLVLLFLVPALFADDAKTMPSLVGRFYVAPIFGVQTGAYDDLSRRYDLPDGTVKFFNLGLALEFGANDWITAAVQWTPGVTLASNAKSAVLAKGLVPEKAIEDVNINLNDVGDLFLGVKLQLISWSGDKKEKTIVETDSVRFSLAPGIKIPLGGPDFEKEYEKLGDAIAYYAKNGESDDAKITFSKMDNHVLGVGGRFYFDYVVNSNFFVNLYNETLFYPVKQDLNKYDPTFAGMKAGFASLMKHPMLPVADLKKAFDDLSGEVNYRSQLTFEIEPVYTNMIADNKIMMNIGLPLNYQYKPAYKYSLNGYDDVQKEMKALLGGMYGSSIPAEAQILALDEEDFLEIIGLEGKPAHNLTIKPNIAMFFVKLPLPMEFKFQYSIPLWGQSTGVQHQFVFQIRAYFAFK